MILDSCIDQMHGFGTQYLSRHFRIMLTKANNDNTYFAVNDPPNKYYCLKISLQACLVHLC